MSNADLLSEYNIFMEKLKKLIYPTKFSPELNLKLERIIHLLELLGNPQKSYPIIHVGGTSGKGSTSTMISQILTTGGFKTGLHTSPYIQIVNEGFQINNSLTPTKVLLEHLEEIQPAINQVTVENPFGGPSDFEVQVALALYLFKKEEVDVAVVEVGLGGSLDATNAIDAQIAVLTNIGLDHTHILGDTIDLIAENKAGIIKPEQTVISGVTQPSAKKIIADRCVLNQAELWQLGKRFTPKYEGGDKKFSVIFPDRTYPDIRLELLGDFQVRNAVIALAAVHAFDPSLQIFTIQKGLEKTKIPGRMEIVQKDPTIILDGAHNSDKIKAASNTINSIFPNKKRIVVFALKQGKTYKEILPYVLDSAELIILTTFSTELWNPMDPKLLEETARKLDPSINSITEPDNQKALAIALQMANSEDLIWVTGSLYLVGNIRNLWYPPEILLKS